ncbi:hypothetical protein ACFSVM_25785 [Paenibacillus shunpengii]|uniref:Uncharacterized protein n=1 Tax=Paenibacillus shunpengii TaxID=2054424 RepID=A0ABW5SW91_9BACL
MMTITIDPQLLKEYLETLAKLAAAGHKVDREISEGLKLYRIATGIESMEEHIDEKAAFRSKMNFRGLALELRNKNLIPEDQLNPIVDEILSRPNYMW